ncbi:MAG TPA: hypothetical protein P5154_06175, partial [Candidatus Izemoplasmatales bacterium]|nr:hypothetical protein [Candidatus Izemoplasmatales bacterium]
MKKKGLLLLLAILGGFAVLGCSQTTGTTTTTATTTSDSTTTSTTTTTTTSALRQLLPEVSTIRLAIGGVYRLTFGFNFTPDAAVTVLFLATDETVASVDASGLVTAVSEGETLIRIAYDETVYADVQIIVLGEYVLVPPTKSIYHPGDSLNLRGGAIEIRSDDVLVERVPMTSEMVISFDSQVPGTQLVALSYQGIAFQFSVYILNPKQEASLFDDFILLDDPASTGRKIEFALTKSNVAEFLTLVDNVYENEEVNIYAIFISPSGDTKRVSAFWYQGYEEQITPTVINKALNLEGTVNDKGWDYDLILRYVEANDPQFRLRFQTDEPGEYDCELIIEVDGAKIQSFSKTFVVEANSTSDSRGILGVDESNRRHFRFSDGTTYIPVGQNVAWYTSSQRKYYDYLSW